MKIRLKGKLRAYFSNNPGITAALMLIIIFSTVLVGAYQKEVTVMDGNDKKQIVAYKGTVRDVLAQNNITLGAKDKITPTLDTVLTDGLEISIKRAVPVNIAVDGKELQLLSAEDTVDDMLAAEGITYGKLDKIYPETDTLIYKNMNVKIARVTEKEITEVQKLASAKDIQEMPSWERGVEKVITNGSDGQKESTIKITYEDGVEKKRELIAENIIKPAVNTLVAVGTLDTRTISRGGETIQFKKMLVMKATSYTDDIACTGKIGGNTATGVKPRRAPNGGKWSTAAVDPRVIPLGTRLWIEGYGYAIAEDVGGAVKGNIIDLFFNRSSAEYENWNTRKTRVYILK